MKRAQPESHPSHFVALFMSIAIFAGCPSEETVQAHANRQAPHASPSAKEGPVSAGRPSALEFVWAEEAVNEGDLGRGLVHHAPGSILRETGSPVPPIIGRARYESHLRLFQSAFPTSRSRVTRVIRGQTWVSVETHLEATVGDPPGTVGPAGARISIRGARIHRIEGGQVTLTRVYLDTPTVLRQLGQTPGRATFHDAVDRPPTLLSSSPQPGLVNHATRFLRAWLSPAKSAVVPRLREAFSFRIHSNDQSGRGLNALKAAWPPAAPDSILGVDFKAAFGAGHWVAIEVSLGDPKGSGRSMLVIARFVGEKIAHLEVYENTLSSQGLGPSP